MPFAGQRLGDINVLELFAGTARLTKSFKRKGVRALALDKTSRRSEGQDVLEFDLSKRDEVDSLLSFHQSKCKAHSTWFTWRHLVGLRAGQEERDCGFSKITAPKNPGL